MKISEILIEFNQNIYQWLQQQFPKWPAYVVKDMLYKTAKEILKNTASDRMRAELGAFVDQTKKDMGLVTWALDRQFSITMDRFSPETQQRLKMRKGGSANPFQVSKDTERHSTQQALLKQTGISSEPIIVIKLHNGYDLLEGWHRTIQAMQKYPGGYKCPAWVGEGASYQTAAQAVIVPVMQKADQLAA